VPSALSTAGPPTIRDLYADADLVLSTSERESYGLPIVEAATSGTPVLCVPYAASHRDVHDEVTANLVVGELPADPTADGWVGGIGRWLLDPTLRPATTRHNRRMVAGSHSSVRLAADLDRCLAAIHGAGM